MPPVVSLSETSECSSPQERRKDEPVTPNGDLVHYLSPKGSGDEIRNERDFYNSFPASLKRKMYMKVDRRLMPLLLLTDTFSSLVRLNLTNASVAGMKEDINLNGSNMSTAMAIFFAPYVILGIPSNMFLASFPRSSLYLGLLTILFGTAALVTGFINQYWQLLMLRAFLGVFEAGVFPAAVFLCTKWYSPQSLALRVACFYLTANGATLLAGPLAAGLSKIETFGLAGWRWIYILIGIMAVLVGVMDVLLLPDSPEKSGWLAVEEKRWLALDAQVKNGGMTDDLDSDGSNSNRFEEKKKSRAFDLRALRTVCSRWRVWAQCSFYMISYIVTYGVKMSAPIILAKAGYPKDQAQVLASIPSFTGGIAAIVGALLSDRFMMRGPFIFGPSLALCGCFAGLLAMAVQETILDSDVVICVFFGLIGLFFGPVGPACSSWISNNLRSTSERAIGVALSISFSGLGGGGTSYLMLTESEAFDQFQWAFGWSLALSAVSFLGAIGVWWSFIRDNKAIRMATGSRSKDAEAGAQGKVVQLWVA